MNCPVCKRPMTAFRDGFNRERFAHPETNCERPKKAKPEPREWLRKHWQRRAVEIDQRWQKPA